MASDYQIPDEFLNDEFDFGFTAADEDELNSLVQLDDQTTPDEIKEMQEKLDLILQMNSTCEGSVAVKDQYDSIQIRRKGSKNGNNNININAPIGLKKGR